jgi:DNA-binding PadR family transcriptional regulator
MEALERQYLRAAYELAMNDPRRAFEEDDIVNHLDLDTSLPDYADRIAAIRWDLTERDYIEGDREIETLGHVRLMLTRAGIEKAERLANPIEQRKELRRDFLRAVYEQANGNPVEYVYWRDLAPRFGFADMQMPPSSIEVIADQLEGMSFITIEIDEGGIYRITAKGVDEVEGNKPQDAGATFQFYGNVQGSVIGTHNTAELTNTFDFRAIEQRIEEEGGEDKEELRQALAQVQRLLERGEYLDRGALSRFSGVMEKHSWFTGSVMQALLGFATQIAAGG